MCLQCIRVTRTRSVVRDLCQRYETMKFLLGLAVGGIGVWAYQSGKLQGLMGAAPEPMQQMWQSGPEIAKPSAAEVSGRQSEPLPTSGA